MTADGDKARESRLRRRARRLGLEIRKSRARLLHLDDLGDYLLMDPGQNAVLAGARFDLSLDDLQDVLDLHGTNLRARW